MRVLISSAGRRVGLMRCFRESFRRLGIPGEIVAADASLDAPALQFADLCWHAPCRDHAEFIPLLLEFATRERIDLIVPTIDPELPFYAYSRQRFMEAGIAVSVSDPETIAICSDKQVTHNWLRDRGVPVPAQENLSSAASQLCGSAETALRFPRIVKPRYGSGSVGVRRVDLPSELGAAIESIASAGRLEDYVLEQVAAGQEHTINVFVDAAGSCRAAVPHRRIEVRAGEVSKAVTTRHQGLIRLARQIAERLPGGRGPLSIQCFLTADDSVLVTEINARFGGGYPLTHRAGARFTDWLLEPFLKGAGRSEPLPNVRGETAKIGCEDSAESCNGWIDQLTMLRFDHEVFLPASSGAELDRQL